MITVGCDLGALFTKLVALDDDRLAAQRVVPTTGTIGDEIDPLIDQMLAEADLSRDRVDALGATGRGASLLRSADFVEDEVHCVTAAVAALMPGVDRVIHLGGQSIAAVALDADGEVRSFVRNDKCAAGTGRFLEMMARKLDVALADVDDLVVRAATPTPISSQCVVYAESEAISHLNGGASPEQVLAGICASIARIAAAQGRRLAGDQGFVITGGVARVEAVAALAAEGLAGERRRFPVDPALAAALGAALLDEVEEGERR